MNINARIYTCASQNITLVKSGLAAIPWSPFSALPVQECCFNHVSCEPEAAASHRHKDVQVEAVIGLPEEEDEDEAEVAGAGQTPIQPGQV